MENYITRKDIIAKAFHDCMKEMYAKAQPEADYDNLIAEYKSGKIGKDERIYERHYLSHEEFQYILDKYISAYGMDKHWKEDIEVLEEYLNKGGHKDKYIKDWDDEHGHHPGYRSYENVPPLKEHIEEIIYDEYDGNAEIAEDVAQKVTDKVMELIATCKNYYRFDREADDFSYNIALGASPTSNPETVKKWWKDNYNVDIEIEERIPRLFWYFDNGYTHQDLIDEFGENYDEVLLKEWEDEKAAKKAEHEQKIKELQEKYNKEQNESKK